MKSKETGLIPSSTPQWLWLDSATHPELQRCEARRIVGGGLPAGQRGFAVVEFRGEVRVPDGISGPVHIQIGADTSYQFFIDGRPLATGPSPSPGDWVALPRIAAWYADEVVIDRLSGGGVAVISVVVRMGEARLCETSAGQGGFFLEGEAPLADGGKFRFRADSSWRVRYLPAWRGPEEFDGTVPPGPWEVPAKVADIWHAEIAPIPVRDEIPRPSEVSTLLLDTDSEIRDVVEWQRIFSGCIKLAADGPCVIEAATFESNPAEAESGPRFKVRFGESGGEVRSPLRSIGGLVVSARAIASDRKIRLSREAVEMRFPEDPETAGFFRCSDEGLTKVWEVARDTLRACRQNLHLDSPKHQEMLACAGDYHVESLMAQACFGDLRLAAFDLVRIARMLEVADGRLFHTSYGLIWVIWLRDVWRLSGDVALVRTCIPAMERLLSRFESYIGPAGIVENPPDWMFLDWLVVEGYSLHHPPRALGQTAMNAWFAGALDAAAELREVARIGAGEAASERAVEVRRAARAALFDSSTGLWIDGLDTPDPGLPPWRPANPAGMRRHGAHANILAALFGLSKGDEARFILRTALSGRLGPIQPWFAHWALEAASGLGLFGELGMPLLRNWVQSVATCSKGLAEGWHAPEPGYSFDHSHAWGGTPAWQLPVRLLGLSVKEPGFRRISLQPNLFGLEWAKIVFPTPLGPIRAELHAGCHPFVEVPPGVIVSRPNLAGKL